MNKKSNQPAQSDQHKRELKTREFNPALVSIQFSIFDNKKRISQFFLNKVFFLLFIVSVFNGKIFSQTIYVTGEANPVINTQEYYEAYADYFIHSTSDFSWSAAKGTVISSGTSPTFWAIIEWSDTIGAGSVTVTDSYFSRSGNKIVSIHSDCEGANAGADVAICTGGSATIGTAAIAGYTYSWSPTSGLNNPNIAQPLASPTATTLYTLTQVGGNMLANGGFEGGYSEFGTDYNLIVGQSYPPGSYAIYPTSIVGSCTINPHGDSYQLYGYPPSSNPSNSRFWYVTLNVSANTTYNFSGFMAQGYTGTVNFDVKFVGNNTGTSTSSFNTNGTCGSYQSFNADWNSSSNTQVTLEIRITNSGATIYLFIDDLKFACKTTDQVEVAVGGSTPIVTPGGPITYYNHYEASNSIVLTCDDAPSYQWYKNNVLISGATSKAYTVEFTGGTSYTDYYKCVTACGTSNTVTFNYAACFDESDYPVTVPAPTCLSQFPISLEQPNMGTGGIYYWDTYHHPSCYSFSDITDIYDRTATFTPSGCGYYDESVYTRAVATNGTEIRMCFAAGAMTGCRMSNTEKKDSLKNNSLILTDKGNNGAFVKNVTVAKVQVFPNPARDKVTIISSNRISGIEFYTMNGVKIKSVGVKHGNTVDINTSKLITGMYMVKVLTDKGTEAVKVVIRQ